MVVGQWLEAWFRGPDFSSHVRERPTLAPKNRCVHTHVPTQTHKLYT